MDLDKTMDDLDLLYDYYRDNNPAASGYAMMACQVKNDKVEDLFRAFTKLALMEAKATAGMIISLGGKIY